MVDVKNLQTGVGVLPLFAVDKTADAQLRRVGFKLICRHDAGADGGKAVQTFAKVPLLVGRLHIAGGNVVQDGVAEHIVPGLPGGHVFGVPAQHHGQLTLVVQLLYKVGVGLDEAAVRHGTGDPLGKVDGVLMLGGKGVGGILFRFVRVSHVVDAQADNVLCRAGNGALQLHGIQRDRRDGRQGQRQPGPHGGGQLRDGLGQVTKRIQSPSPQCR